MATLDTILSLLDKWPAWNRITKAPDRIDDLEKRLAALERAARSPAVRPGKACKYCGEMSGRLVESRTSTTPFGALGAKDERWQCGACGKDEWEMGVR